MYHFQTDAGVWFLARTMLHRPVAVLIYRVTGGGARLGDSHGIRIPPVTDEAIPHVRGDGCGFAPLIALHDPVTLPVGDRVQQTFLRLVDKLFPHLLSDPHGPIKFLLQKKIYINN